MEGEQLHLPIGREYTTPNIDGFTSRLYSYYDKLIRDLGYIQPQGSDELLERILDEPEENFDQSVREYVDFYADEHATPEHPLTDIHEHRGLFASLSQLYYERCRRYDFPNTDASRQRLHNAKHYLQVIYDDMRVHGEQPNDNLYELLIEHRLKIRNFPDLPRSLEVVKKFHATALRCLRKMDPNIQNL